MRTVKGCGWVLGVTMLLGACSTSDPQTEPDAMPEADASQPVPDTPATQGDALDDTTPDVEESGAKADVTGVSVSGGPGSYSFNVTLKSDDTGCAQFADWWEVLDSEGNLLYRRVLLHSHVGEQPFTRSGGPVDITADTTVVVRGHMNTTGYATDATSMRGSPSQGFEPFVPPDGFGASAEQQPPLPQDCAF